jgi:hypothetical protein
MNFRTPKVAVVLPRHSDTILNSADPLPQPSFQRSDPNSTPSDGHLARHMRNLPSHTTCLTLDTYMYHDFRRSPYISRHETC